MLHAGCDAGFDASEYSYPSMYPSAYDAVSETSCIRWVPRAEALWGLGEDDAAQLGKMNNFDSAGAFAYLFDNECELLR